MKIKHIAAAVLAVVMAAATSVTCFAASEVDTFFDDDGYTTYYDDGTGYRYNARTRKETYFDEDGDFVEVDRRGNITYYDADEDDTYYYSNTSSRSSSRSSSGRSSSRRTSTRVYNDIPTSSPSGWQFMNGARRFRRYNGSFAANCWEQVNGKWYSFDTNGNMRTNQWVRHTTNEHLWYYVGSDGSMVKNTNIGGYFINANGECFC